LTKESFPQEIRRSGKWAAYTFKQALVALDSTYHQNPHSQCERTLLCWLNLTPLLSYFFSMFLAGDRLKL
jgi:hypothetical protein